MSTVAAPVKIQNAQGRWMRLQRPELHPKFPDKPPKMSASFLLEHDNPAITEIREAIYQALKPVARASLERTNGKLTDAQYDAHLRRLSQDQTCAQFIVARPDGKYSSDVGKFMVRGTSKTVPLFSVELVNGQPRYAQIPNETSDKFFYDGGIYKIILNFRPMPMDATRAFAYLQGVYYQAPGERLDYARATADAFELEAYEGGDFTPNPAIAPPAAHGVTVNI